jgi:hypothetical protein
MYCWTYIHVNKSETGVFKKSYKSIRSVWHIVYNRHMQFFESGAAQMLENQRF